MKAVSGTQMRGLDRRTITEAKISGERLMERAGMLAGSALLKWMTGAGLDASEVVLLAGKGNNGGDAFVAARLLAEAGYDVSLHCTAPESELSGDALTMFRRMPASVRDHISSELTPADLTPNTVVADGLLGTGFHGALREPYRTWCRLVNASGCPVAALDIPSGLDADSGEADPDAVVADITFTMAAPKTGMFSSEGIRHTGRLRVLDIGIPAAFVNELPDTVECTGPEEAYSIFRREAFDAHKYTRGHLFVAGGCRFYPGAPLLAAEAGLRAGAGLVTCCLPEHAEIHASVPKALIVRRLASDTGFFCAKSATELLAMSDKAGAFVVGPGMGTAVEGVGFLEKMLAVKVPLVLDADALNLLSAHPDLIEKLRRRESPTVLTPHPGELNRLLAGLELSAEGRGRSELAVLAAERLNAVVVGKGARTVVAAPDGRFAVNLSGCPALATAGTGDLLAGMTGALLLDREVSVFDAVRAAVFLHGQAAELAAPLETRGFIADDFLPRIGAVVRS
ncbi:MAG: NAD(P)H-hydrate dehydratase [Lentisphaeria bacterium]|nr:NAD(P)H-hydrate dehydratase [Lentisphaeria bacterium]